MVIYVFVEQITILIRRYVMEKFQNKYLEIKNINKDIVAWLEDIVEENNCRVERKEWKSKYNSYVIYDYEPFCSDGFEINLTCSSFSREHLDFLKYLYENNNLNRRRNWRSCYSPPINYSRT